MRDVLGGPVARPGRGAYIDHVPARTVTDATFESEVLGSPLPVLVDFWAPGCAPCRMIAPLVDELADQYGGRLRVVKVNAHESRAAATRLQVRATPNLVLLKSGQVTDQMVGAPTRGKLVAAIERVLAG
jgi:thioredoxin 1